MSSEVGGRGSSSVFARSAGAGGGFGGEDGDAGLGVTGDGGVLDNVVGMDSIGGLLDGLGSDNPLDAILGAGSNGLIPSAAAALAGDPDAEVVGLGVLGEGGLVADLAGTGLLGGMLDTGGVLTASIAGGNDGLLGALLNDRIGSSPLASVAGPVAAALPSSALGDVLAQLPALGLTGSDGLVADLIGTDILGNLVGETPLGGGNEGQLGNIVPAGEPPLGYVGDLTDGLLNVVAGSDSSPASSALAPAVPVLENILGAGAGIVGGAVAPAIGALGSVPVVGARPVGASPAAADTGAPSMVAPGILAPVTGLVGGLVGGI